MSEFPDTFKALTGYAPFRWQERLYARLVEGCIPARCDLPTGLGKTAVIPIWVCALAYSKGPLPRRLVYIVNRRTVVDQTTAEAERLRQNLDRAGLTRPLRDLCSMEHGVPLAISTLRGQFADNREWSTDPSRPAVIIGTVDMIGSRLLFGGYGVGFRSHPLHAGFLGQGALIVHDEAHLEPAFQSLLENMRQEQKRCGEFRPLRLIELTATTRNDNGQATAFTITEEDRTDPIITRRIDAHKQLHLQRATDDKDIVGDVATWALKHRQSDAAVLVFVHTPDDVKKVCDILKRSGVGADHVQQLTGVMRGFERDNLVTHDPVFMRFMPAQNRNPEVTPPTGTVYLVCTSAGEVGIDISADHMICDLSTCESMVQRLGRVNRYGDRDDTRIDVVHPAVFGKVNKKTREPNPTEIDWRRQNTLDLLRKLPEVAQGNGSPAYDASPRSLMELRERCDPPCKFEEAFAPEPTTLPATDILFDAWALTSIREKMPGRPPVEPYLHGIADWQPPETHVAWRQEVEIISGELLDRYPAADLLDDYRLKPRELLRDRSDRVFRQLEAFAKRHPNAPVWVMEDRGAVVPMTLTELVGEQSEHRIKGCTILLPPSVGGLAGGMLDASSKHVDGVAYDVADDMPNMPSSPAETRVRVMSDDLEYASKTAGMRLVRSIVAGDREEDEEKQPLRWDWFESRPLEGGRTARRAVALDTHATDVESRARRIVKAVSLPADLAGVVVLAARLHDWGKRRPQFQATLGNRDRNVPLAKAGRNGARLPEPFRHEFASVLDAQADPGLLTLSNEMQDLVLHLIAAHHGRARPHFSIDEAYDPDRPLADAELLARETPRRFARLQRRYGRWGLAYLESLLRAADWAASAAPSAFLDDEETAR